MSEPATGGLSSVVARVTAAMEARPVPMDPREIRLEVGRSGDDVPLKDVIAALSWLGSRGVAQRVSKKWLAAQGMLDPEYPHQFETAWVLVAKRPPGLRRVRRLASDAAVSRVLGVLPQMEDVRRAALAELVRRHPEEFAGIVDALLDADGRLP